MSPRQLREAVFNERQSMDSAHLSLEQQRILDEEYDKLNKATDARSVRDERATSKTAAHAAMSAFAQGHPKDFDKIAATIPGEAFGDPGFEHFFERQQALSKSYKDGQAKTVAATIGDPELSPLYEKIAGQQGPEVAAAYVEGLKKQKDTALAAYTNEHTSAEDRAKLVGPDGQLNYKDGAMLQQIQMRTGLAESQAKGATSDLEKTSKAISDAVVGSNVSLDDKTKIDIASMIHNAVQKNLNPGGPAAPATGELTPEQRIGKLLGRDVSATPSPAPTPAVTPPPTADATPAAAIPSSDATPAAAIPGGDEGAMRVAVRPTPTPEPDTPPMVA